MLGTSQRESGQRGWKTKSVKVSPLPPKRLSNSVPWHFLLSPYLLYASNPLYHYLCVCTCMHVAPVRACARRPSTCVASSHLPLPVLVLFHFFLGSGCGLLPSVRPPISAHGRLGIPREACEGCGCALLTAETQTRAAVAAEPWRPRCLSAPGFILVLAFILFCCASLVPLAFAISSEAGSVRCHLACWGQ